MKYIIKDRIENFDDYFQCRKEMCKLNDVKSWFYMFVDSYNNCMTPRVRASMYLKKEVQKKLNLIAELKIYFRLIVLSTSIVLTLIYGFSNGSNSRE